MLPAKDYVAYYHYIIELNSKIRVKGMGHITKAYWNVLWLLTYWDRDNIAAIFQTTFSNE